MVYRLNDRVPLVGKPFLPESVITAANQIAFRRVLTSISPGFLHATSRISHLPVQNGGESENDAGQPRGSGVFSESERYQGLVDSCIRI